MEEKEFTFDFSKIGEKLKGNKKIIVYAILALILLMSLSLRLIPADNYYLSAMDPYWHYRHASEILDHGYPGTTLKEVDGQLVPWDEMHDAPFGESAKKEFYPYFIAYSYKYIGRFLVQDLMTWDKYTPVIFGVLAVLAMFLLVRQLFGDKAGLAAAFMYNLSTPFLTRSVAGFADTDAPIAFFTILTFYLFVLAWDRKSFIYAGIAGLSLGLFGLTWPGGYAFTPLLIVGVTVLFFIYRAIFTYLKKGELKETLKEDWKRYVALLIFLIIGLSLVAIIIDPSFANFFKVVFGFTKIKNLQLITGTDIRNVFLTVAEMNPPGDNFASAFKFITYRVHVVSIILLITFFTLLPFGLWKKLKERMYHLLLLSLWLIATFYSSFTAVRFIGMLAVPLSIFMGIAMAYLVSKINSKKPVISILIGLFLFSLVFLIPNLPTGGSVGPSYYKAAYLTAKQSGPGVGGNWITLFEWMKTETPEDAIMASWWDPGHAVTALGERRVVADGSQNDRHVHDLAVAFTTTNESIAVENLKKYNVSYFFTSSDLISKYGAISFLGTGQGENYPTVPLSEATPVQNGTIFKYNIGSTSSILLKVEGGNISASIRQGYNTQKIDRLIYFTNEGMAFQDDPSNDTIDAALYIYPDARGVIFLIPKLENNILTRLHLLNGYGLEHFELVKDFGGQIKVYKVKY